MAKRALATSVGQPTGARLSQPADQACTEVTQAAYAQFPEWQQVIASLPNRQGRSDGGAPASGHLAIVHTCVNSRPKKKICADQYDHNSTTTIDPAAPNADPTAALPR